MPCYLQNKMFCSFYGLNHAPEPKIVQGCHRMLDKSTKKNLLFTISHDIFANTPSQQHTGVPVINLQKRFLQQINNKSSGPWRCWRDVMKERIIRIGIRFLGIQCIWITVNVIDFDKHCIRFSLGSFHVNCMGSCLFRCCQFVHIYGCIIHTNFVYFAGQ